MKTTTRMIRIYGYRNKNALVTYSIEDNPYPGSFGDYILLKNFYRTIDTSSIKGVQTLFNMEYLISMQAKYGVLHCAYCNKSPLRIYGFHESCRQNDMATTDHILPKSTYPDLAFDESNLTVACNKCNVAKDRDIIQPLFPYI